MAPTANLDQKDKQFVAKVSCSQHLGICSEHCQASDNQSRAEAFLFEGNPMICVCVFIIGDLNTIKALKFLFVNL